MSLSKLLGFAPKTKEKRENTELKCSDCWNKKTRGEVKKQFDSPPFLKPRKKTYYCGCYGWE